MASGWDSQVRNLNGSNMSLNLPPHGYYPQQRDIPPTGWINGWAPNMYPYPVGMIPVINQGIFTVSWKHRADI